MCETYTVVPAGYQMGKNIKNVPSRGFSFGGSGIRKIFKKTKDFSHEHSIKFINGYVSHASIYTVPNPITEITITVITRWWT